jgi:hypothetical protein
MSQFDEIATVKGLGEVPFPYHHLSFSAYNIFAPRDPALNGKISESDYNCAVSAPNALIGSRYNGHDSGSTRGAYFGIANATAMMEDGLCSHFTLSKFKIKPLDSPLDPTTTRIAVIGYKHNSYQTVKWEVTFDQGYHDPLYVKLKEFSRENWETLSGVEILADYGVDALDWEFCIDDIELLFSHSSPTPLATRQRDQVVMNGPAS